MAVSINGAGTFTVETRQAGQDCEALTNWAVTKLEGAGGTPSAVQSVGSTDLFVEGTDAVETVTNKTRILLAHTPGTSYDFTSDSSGSGTVKVPNGFVWIWSTFLASGSLLTKATGGYQIALGDGTNRGHWNIAGSDSYLGGFRKWAIAVDLATRYTTDDVGTPQIGNITEIGVITDVGGTTTRFSNFVVDAYDIGDGLTFTGSTTTDSLFSEAFDAQDATKIGILENSNGIIFAQGNLEFDGTSQVSSGETLIFTDTVLDSSFVYALNFTGSHTLTNSNINKAGGVSYNLDTTGATFTQSGGVITGFNTLTYGSGQTISGAVFQDGGASSIPTTVSESSFNQCGQITLTGSGQLSGCTINESTAAVAVSCDTLADVPNCTFISDGTGHAVDLGTISTSTSMTWNCTATGYAASNGTTGNETILVNVASGQTLTINDEGTGLTYYNTGLGTVNVISGAVTVRVRVQDTAGNPIENARVYLTRASDSAVIFNALTNASGVVENTAYTYTADDNVTGWARKASSSPLYKTGPIAGTITSTGFNGTAIMISDE